MLRTTLLRNGPAVRKTAWSAKSVHSSASPSRPRMYRYAIDVHGQLFLHDTTPKNLTSCFKNPDFLNFFFARVRHNEQLSPPPGSSTATMALADDWTETLDCTQDDALALARRQGYHWISPCQGEYNVIRAADSPIVYRELTDDGHLVWAGNFRVPFQPDALRVDAESGYVYHPSPEPPVRSLRKRLEESSNHPYGAFSLLSSSLVLQRLADGLELDPDQFANARGGSITWQGERYELTTLQADDVKADRKFLEEI